MKSTQKWNDEVASQIRQVRNELAEEHEYDVRNLVRSLQASQSRHGQQLVNLPAKFSKASQLPKTQRKTSTAFSVPLCFKLH